jgi:hypothetical protein
VPAGAAEEIAVGAWKLIAGIVVSCALLPSCSGEDRALTGSPEESTTTTTARPEGPASDLSEELSGSTGLFVAAAATEELPSNWLESERVASGTATSYTPVGELTEDGMWTFEEEAVTAPYRTRVLVRRPADPEDFSGTVVVEWLNVSSGLDANPEWGSLGEELIRQGHAWVGVSAQLIGVEGGAVLVKPPGVGDMAGKGLVNLDPARYGTLEHPGDGYSFDMFTQVARALRAGGPAMGDLVPTTVLAAGESQSAIALTTYYNGVQPLTEAFDGFFVHSRASVALPLVAPGQAADLAGSMGTAPTRLRTDLGAPVLTLQSEGDVVGLLDSAVVRQPDDEHHRLWEVAGTAHADTHMVGPLAGAIDCGVPINDGPMHVVAKAGLRSLDEWVTGGAAPPEADRLALIEGAEAQVVRDPDGIAEGGIRTPPVDVPLDVLSGEPGPSPEVFCMLMGSTVPLPAERISELHPSQEDYLRSYTASTGEAVEAGFVLPEDREAMLAYADPSRVPG